MAETLGVVCPRRGHTTGPIEDCCSSKPLDLPLVGLRMIQCLEPDGLPEPSNSKGIPTLSGSLGST